MFYIFQIGQCKEPNSAAVARRRWQRRPAWHRGSTLTAGQRGCTTSAASCGAPAFGWPCGSRSRCRSYYNSWLLQDTEATSGHNHPGFVFPMFYTMSQMLVQLVALCSLFVLLPDTLTPPSLDHFCRN